MQLTPTWQVTPNHFGPSNRRSLHFSLEGAEPVAIKERLRKLAKALHYHFAFLDGTAIRSGKAVMDQLGTIYSFPGAASGAIVRPSWDGTRDWLTDLTWLTGWPPDPNKARGFLLYYYDLRPLFKADPVEFGNLIGIIARASTGHASDGLAMHLVGAPISSRAEIFLKMTRFYPQVCTECLYGIPPVDSESE